tara:strand:- start:19990 stop:21477 length:1488 start_codon:yes stop_codon:yes gene_type:complete
MGVVDQLKRLGKDTFSYGFSSALQKLITMFLFPIYARLLTPSDFGIQDLILTAVYITSLFLILGLDSGVMLYYYEAKEDEKKTILSSYLWFEILVSLPVVAMMIIFSNQICLIIFSDPSLSEYFRVGVLAIPFSLVVGAMLSTLRLTFQTKKFVILTTVGVFLQLGSAVLFVIIYGMGVRGILISILISYALQSILGGIFTFRSYTISFSRLWMKKLLKVGIPLIPAALSFWVMSYANRFFLINYADLEEIGLLSVVNRISSILLLFLTAFSSAWGPYAYSIATDKEVARVTYSKVLTYFMLLSMIAAVLLSLYSKELILILATSAYERGSSLIFIYALSSISWIVLYIIGMGTGMAKKNYHYTVAVIGGALLNTLLNYLLIPSYGVAGAAYATLTGNLLAMVYMYYAGQYYFRVNYEFGKVFKILALSILVAVGGIIIDEYYEVWQLSLSLYKLIIFVFFVIMLFAIGVINLSLVKQGYSFLKTKYLNQKSIQA